MARTINVFKKEFSISLLSRDLLAVMNTVYLLEKYGKPYYAFLKKNGVKVISKEVDEFLSERFADKRAKRKLFGRGESDGFDEEERPVQ